MADRIGMFKPYVSEKAIGRVASVLKSGWVGEGKVVEEFEKRFQELIGAPFPVAVNSGTSALHLALVMTGIGPGDEVITTAQTFIATSHVVLAQGARSVFADVQYETGNIDPHDIEHRISERTKAILVVHWGGYPCDMDEIHEIAARRGLVVIEDAAHALGAAYKGRPVGSISPFTCFSFQAIKHITCGDGGMLCVADERSRDEARRRRWFGIDRMRRTPSILGEPLWDVSEVGYKYHMNDIAGALGLEHLLEFDDLFKRRAYIAGRYREELSSVAGITLFACAGDRVHANWLFSLHVEQRVPFIQMMKSKGIDVSVVHQRIDTNSVFGGRAEGLSNLERLTETMICLPLHNLLTDADCEYVIKSIRGGW